jgi:hypothetical protein
MLADRPRETVDRVADTAKASTVSSISQRFGLRGQDGPPDRTQGVDRVVDKARCHP